MHGFRRTSVTTQKFDDAKDADPGHSKVPSISGKPIQAVDESFNQTRKVLETL
jgi:hypothetical protein